jgi:hypothetical protein
MRYLGPCRAGDAQVQVGVSDEVFTSGAKRLSNQGAGISGQLHDL